jgi:hypothetical protein
VIFYIICFSIFTFFPPALFAFNDSYDISEVYVEINLGYDTYYAEIENSGIMSTDFGKVKRIYKKGRISDIGYGKYEIQLKWISDDLYKIVGTSFVLKIKYANKYDFSGYEDWLLDSSGFSGSVKKK